MCGICGELRLDGTQARLAGIDSMLPPLARRGPDHAGSYSDGPLAMGHRRLAIIDLSEHSNQPLVDTALGLAIVFNGTIYNYPELRRELQRKGHHFSTSGDTETILKAYAEWGERCVEHLDGMFAFAIWEMRARTLFLARDRLGIKPLYYSHDGERFLFASNSQALLAAGGIDCSIDPVGLHHQLTLHGVIPAPRTILKGIAKLPPACTMSVAAAGERSRRSYWFPAATRPDLPRGAQEWCDAVREALQQAVGKRMVVADVPVGVLLSGGLDSSLLVALLAQLGVQEIRTFSIGFDDVGAERGSEFEYSDQVVQRFGTSHRRLRISNDQVLERLPEAVASMAEPMVGQDAVAFYLLAEQVSREVKVVQSGQGADELFGGYFWYPLMAAEEGGSELQRFARHYFDRDHREFLQSVTAPWRGDDYTSATIAALLERPGADSFMDRVLRMDVTTLIVDDPVKRVDNMTMAWGLEARVPFLDHHLVELALQMPPELRLKDGGKYPLKRIARGLLPDAVIDRPKGYFPMPALKYLRGPFLEFMREILLSDACRRRALFEPGYVERLLAAPEQHFTRIRGSKLWHMALLELWLQLNVDCSRSASGGRVAVR